MAYPGAGRDPTVKPEWGANMDYSHSLAEGLAAYICPLEADTVLRDFGERYPLALLGTGGSWSATSEGVAYNFGGNTGNAQGSPPVTGYPFSVTVRLVMNSMATAGIPFLLGAPYSGTNWTAWYLQINTNGSATLYSTTVNSFVGATSAAGLIAAGVPATLTCACAGATDRRLYINGVLAATSSISDNPTGINVLRMGADVDASHFYNNYKLLHAAIHKRALSAGEAQTLADAPYGWFLSSNTRRFYVAGQALLKSLLETLGWSDTRLAQCRKALVEALGYADARAIGLSKTVSDLLALSDGRSTHGAEALADVLALADDLLATRNAGGQTLLKLLAETLGYADSVQGSGIGLAVLTLILAGGVGDSVIGKGNEDGIMEVGGRA